MAIGLIIGNSMQQQEPQQPPPQRQAYPNCSSLYGAGAVNGKTNPQRCVCRTDHTKVTEGNTWHCQPRDVAQGGERGIGGGTQSRAETEKIQESLNLLGYDAGVVDGAGGEKTRQAILRFQSDNRFPQTGQLSAAEQQVLFKSVKEKATKSADQRSPFPSPATDPSNQRPDPGVELEFWKSVKDSKVRAEIEDFIKRYPESPFVKLAENRLQQIAREEEESRHPSEPPKVAPGMLPPIDDAEYPRARQRRADAVAVIIGNSAYKNGAPSVDYGVRDAEAMKLLAVKTLGVESENVILLKDASRVDMDNVFGNEKDHKGKLWRLIDPDGRSDLYVFYSGHGVPGGEENAETFLLPVDGDADRPNLSAYPIKQLMENLAKFPTKSTTVFLDACFSGKAADDNSTSLIKSASPVFVANIKAIPSDPSKITVFAAAGQSQLASWDNKRGHGIFTNHVLMGLAGEADENKDKQVTAKELQDYLRRQVRKDARREHGREQDPWFAGKDPESFVLSSF